MRPFKALCTILPVVLSLALTGCGGSAPDAGGGGGDGGGGDGGGGGGGSASWSSSPEYTNQYGLSLIKASALYANGASGESVTVAVIDTGIDLNHSEFAGRINGRSIDIISGSHNITDTDGHGTFVTGIIAANYGSGNVQGVAYEADILAIDAYNGRGFTDSDLYDSIIYAVDNNAKIINMSLGGAGDSPYLNRALKYAADRGVAVVIATGNDSCRSNPRGAGCLYGSVAPINEPGQEAGNPNYAGHVIAVGAVDENGRVSDYSNSCAAQNTAYCLVAPGDNIYSTTPGGGYGYGSGTSFATPHVAGALALLKDAFPNLTMAQAIEIILATASDRGFGTPSFNRYDSDYGNGLLDIAAAMGPAGELRTSADGDIAVASTSRLNMSGAMGDSLSKEYAFANMVLYDDYQREYRTDISGHINNVSGAKAILEKFTDFNNTNAVQTASSTIGNLSTSLSFSEEVDELGSTTITDDISVSASYALGSGARVGFSTGAGNHDVTSFNFVQQSGPDFAMTERALSPLGFLTSEGQGVSLQQNYNGWNLSYGLRSATINNAENFAADIKIDRAFENGLSIGLSGSMVREDGGFLGSTGTGAFNNDYQGNTMGMTLGLGYEYENLSIYGQYTSAKTKVETSGAALLNDFSTLNAQALSLGMRMKNVVKPRDQLSITLAKPLRVNSGSAAINADVALDSDQVELGRDRVSFAPSGSQTNIELGYHSTAKNGAVWGFGLAYIIDPNHDASADHELAAGIRYLVDF